MIRHLPSKLWEGEKYFTPELKIAFLRTQTFTERIRALAKSCVYSGDTKIVTLIFSSSSNSFARKYPSVTKIMQVLTCCSL